jgi:hypothetical protein
MRKVLNERGINEIVCFHCDHFEPFRVDLSGKRTGPEHVRYWLEQTEKHEFSRHASIFFSSQRFCVMPDGKPGPHHLPGDTFQFTDSSMREEDAEIAAMVWDYRDFHIHIHHEFWTSGEITATEPDPPGDSARLDYILRLLLEYYHGLGIQPGKWAFVHGCWALNASDRDICCIEDEIQILMRHGCVADFSFPAGRHWCDPQRKHPIIIKPVTGRKCYDLPEAEAYPAQPHQCIPENRFFIWNSGVSGVNSSLDNIASGTLSPTRAAIEQINHGPVFDGVLYVKTHCHSMWWEHWNGPDDSNSPLLNDNVAKFFLSLESVGVPVHYRYVTDILRRFSVIE